MSGRGRGGRGAYFKQRYGGGRGRGRGRTPAEEFLKQFDAASSAPAPAPAAEAPSIPGASGKDWHNLERDLRNINSQQYGAYKRLLGKYCHSEPRFTLNIDHVQADPYAAPSKSRVVMPWSETSFPDSLLESDIRRVALCDFITRVAGSVIQARHMDRNVGNANGGWSGPKGGAFSICMPGQEILPRTSAIIAGTDSIELRFTVSLPAAGRSILGEQAYQILAVNLVEVVCRSLLHSNLDQAKLEQHVKSAETQQSLRAQLANRRLIAFVANGSVLPRASGASQCPMTGAGVVRFQSPKELEVVLTASDGTHYTGMGIPRGICMLTGGGFHGKSTLLEALELGIYNHIPGDGREAVVTDPTAVKVRAEDGRVISKTDITPFISQLPGNKDTLAFCTEDASGSTSMAANIQEALEAGSKTLLIDEDSSATNLLVRDTRMRKLISNEPITPLVSKARALLDHHGVSTIIVIGGLGDWLSVADHVIVLDSYIPRYANEAAREIVLEHPSNLHTDTMYGSIPARAFRVDLSGVRSPYATRKKFITMNSQTRDAVDDPSKAEAGIDLHAIDQIVEIGQTRTLAILVQEISGMTSMSAATLAQICDKYEHFIGIEKSLPTRLNGGELVAVRSVELAAALSRLRGVTIRVD